MGRTLAVTVLVIDFFLICLAVATLISGITGNSWWIGKEDTMEEGIAEGLWRSCNTNKDLLNPYSRKTECTDRKDVFKFPSSDGRLEERNKDITLVLLLIGTCLSAVSWITTLCLCCCLSKRSLWRCNTIITGILSLLAAGTSFGGVIFAEVEFDNKWNQWDYGWSAICAWIGGAASLIAAVVLFILACMNPKSKSSRPVLVGKANQGYAGYNQNQTNIQMQQAHVPNYR